MQPPHSTGELPAPPGGIQAPGSLDVNDTGSQAAITFNCIEMIGQLIVFLCVGGVYYFLDFNRSFGLVGYCQMS